MATATGGHLGCQVLSGTAH